ncbi:MAG: prepilin-type N-terminal cleavage/methylation domain-containing protein [Gammaproteobacteria bacterium]|jgi:type IV pilus assembly protein PilE|nr:prepilin-type N-terminal cleavage/methylation domain-containing protein [Gammaproteobacteria bacterium]
MKHSDGFSLIELTIVVGLLAIISMVAASYFGDNVTRANRTDARAGLTEVSGSLEKCRSLYGSYNSASCNVTFPRATDSNFYSITAALAASTFTLTATPVAGGPQAADADCTTLTLTNTGVQGATGADTSRCW